MQPNWLNFLTRFQLLGIPLLRVLNVAVETQLARNCSFFFRLQAVDRHFKLPHASSKPVRSSSSMEDSTHKTLRFALRASLKTAIYRITTTFGDHLKYDLSSSTMKGCKNVLIIPFLCPFSPTRAVQMSPEHQKRLQQFLEYKE